MTSEENDIYYEREIAKRSSTRAWFAYINQKKGKFLILDQEKNDLEFLVLQSNQLWKYYEKALVKYPRSYKLWVDYCDTRSDYVYRFLMNHQASVQKTNGTFELALKFLYTCPRIWLNYLDFIGRQKRITLLRKTMNKALLSLPITQHERLWQCYMPLVRETKSIPTVFDAYKRFLMIHPEFIEDACSYFIQQNATKAAAYFLKKLLKDPNFKSLDNRPKYYWWSQMASIIMEDPEIEDAIKILKKGCQEFIIEAGRQWVTLANHYSRLNDFPKAIQIYESALNSVATANDFSVVFNGACGFYKAMISMSAHKELFLAKLEDLIEKHAILLNSTLIRQNKNSIKCWIERTQLYLDKYYYYESKTREELWDILAKIIPQLPQLLIMIEAIETVDPKNSCDGRYCDLWICLSQLVDDPPVVLEAALKDSALLVSDLVGVYLYYADYLIINNKPVHAHELMLRAVEDKRVRNATYATNLWSLALDLECNFGDSLTIPTLFEKCLLTRAATQRHVIAFAEYFEEVKDYEKMFHVLQRGIAASGWPSNKLLWHKYLSKYIEVYQGTRREQTRDIFEAAIEETSSKESINIYLLYAYFEENFGIINWSFDIYRRAIEVNDDDQIWEIWIRSANKSCGVTETRKVYDLTLSHFNGHRALTWVRKYAAFETKMTEYDRARAIYTHGCQFADPEKVPDYWNEFDEFEVRYGTTDTYKEMLSQKNLARMKFNHSINLQFIKDLNEDELENEEQELAEADAHKEIMIQEQLIAPTIYDAGNYTLPERFERQKRFAKA